MVAILKLLFLALNGLFVDGTISYLFLNGSKTILRPNFVLLTESEQFKQISARLFFLGGGGWASGFRFVTKIHQVSDVVFWCGFFLIELCKSSLLMVLYSVFCLDRNLLRSTANFFGDFLSGFWYFSYPNAPPPPLKRMQRLWSVTRGEGGYPYNGLNGTAPSERSTFSGFKFMKG